VEVVEAGEEAVVEEAVSDVSMVVRSMMHAMEVVEAGEEAVSDVSMVVRSMMHAMEAREEVISDVLMHHLFDGSLQLVVDPTLLVGSTCHVQLGSVLEYTQYVPVSA